MNALQPSHGPIYPLAYAARLAGLDPLTARRWAQGYTYKKRGQPRTSEPVFRSTGDVRRGTADVTFEDLLTLRLVRGFREKGLGLPTIRKAAQIAAQRYGVENPFVTRSFRTDGRKIFIELTKRGDIEEPDKVLVDTLSGQQQFKEIVEPSLFRDVVFVGDWPSQWFPRGTNRHVVIRPDKAFGAPHIVDKGVRTDVIADAVAAEGSGDTAVQAVAAWFGLTEDEVRDAVIAEAEWRSPKAT